MAKPTEEAKTKEQNTEKSTQIKIDDFKKCEIKVGTVLECENIEGSEKLLKFKIDLDTGRINLFQ